MAEDDLKMAWNKGTFNDRPMVCNQIIQNRSNIRLTCKTREK